MKLWSILGDMLLLYLLSTVTIIVKQKVLIVKNIPDILERKSTETSTDNNSCLGIYDLIAIYWWSKIQVTKRSDTVKIKNLDILKKFLWLKNHNLIFDNIHQSSCLNILIIGLYYHIIDLYPIWNGIFIFL